MFVTTIPLEATKGENGIFARFRFFSKSKNHALTFVFALSRPNATLVSLRVGRDLLQESKCKEDVFVCLRFCLGSIRAITAVALIFFGLPKIVRFLGRGINKRMGTSLSKLCMSDVCDDVLSKIARICLLIV